MGEENSAITNSIEMKKAVTELIEKVMKENDGKEGKENVIFSQRAKALAKKIADFSRKTKIWQETERQRTQRQHWYTAICWTE